MSKLERLKELLSRSPSVLVAFSGGVDSTFLLKVAHDVLGERCHAITCVSDTMARSEARAAERLAQEIGLGERHHTVMSDELAQPGYADNPVNRCALCKTELMDLAEPLAARLGCDVIVLGTNTDDLGDFRPGIAAASERGARAPMVEVGMSKDDVRFYSRELGLRTWDKPQIACLSSRFPYGTRITRDRLRRIDTFEDDLRALGFGQLRVRFHDTIARLELPAADLPRALEQRERIVELGKRHGFTYVAVDLAGFRSGSLNEPLVKLGRKAG